MSNKVIRWGIIGCGKIAHKFVQDLALVEDGELMAVASRNMEKATDFKAQYSARKTYGSYDDLFKDEDVDIVYIATPHTSHAELSIQAMESGKHVLCEKPLAINATDAQMMIDVSKKTNRFFMEALWTRFNPNILKAKEIIDSGVIGEVEYINADFAFKFDGGIESRAVNLYLGGGALLDIGIYPAFLTYLLLGIPEKVVATANFNKITKCDMQSAMIFAYPKAQAVLYSGFTTGSDMVARICGTEGQIYLHNTWHMAEGFTVIKDNSEEIFNKPLLGHGYTYEIIECHKCIRYGQIESQLWSHQNSLELMSLLDKVRQQIGLKYPKE
jgi:predicted dehydrogenase